MNQVSETMGAVGVETSTAPVVVGIGEILWDVIGPQEKYLGGAPANFAFHSAQLGARGAVVSCIGQDALGQEIEAQLKQEGLETEFLRRDLRHPTGTVTVRTNDKGQPDYTIHTNVAWDYLPFDARLRELAGQADAVCFGTLAQRSPTTRASLHAFLTATRRSCLRVFDINLRQSFYDCATIEASLAVCDALKLNHEELPIVARLLELPGNEKEILAALIARFNLRLVALTRGEGGSVLATKFRRSEHPGYPATVVDTVGAGDAFTAALVRGLLHYADLDQLHDGASRLASFVCSQSGATPLLPAQIRSEVVK